MVALLENEKFIVVDENEYSEQIATASGSSGSHRARRLRPDLPLLPCGKCQKKSVLEYTCPDRNVSCLFFPC
jgi:hypothetical protein